MSYGVVPTGFNLKRLETSRQELVDSIQAKFGTAFDLSVDSNAGQELDSFNEIISQLWEVAQAVYWSQSPSTAEDVSLDNVASITNITRLPATKSTVTVTITGTPTTVVNTGFTASVDGNTDSRFVTLEDVIIGGGGTIDVEMTAEETGPILANTGTLTVIETPIVGVDSITNAADAILGRYIETNSELKSRRLTLLQRSGTAASSGIRNALLLLDNVVQALVLDGVIEHQINIIVQGGDDNEIAETIFLSVGAGLVVGLQGAEIIPITDSQGITRDIKFARPSLIDVYMIINITPNTNPAEGELYPVDGDQQVKDAVLSFVVGWLIGQDVVVNQFYTPINTINGVIGIEIKVGTAPAPTLSNNIGIDFDELADFDSARITVNS